MSYLQCSQLFQIMQTRGALQIREQSPKLRNGRPVESYNAEFWRDQSVCSCETGFRLLSSAFATPICVCSYILTSEGFIVDNVVECNVWPQTDYVFTTPSCICNVPQVLSDMLCTEAFRPCMLRYLGSHYIAKSYTHPVAGGHNCITANLVWMHWTTQSTSVH